jgi:hypothetical protein
MQRAQQSSPLVVGDHPHAALQPFPIVLLIGLMTTLTAVLSGLFVRFVPTWQPGYLVMAVALVAGEAALVRYRMLRGQHLAAGALRYVGAELFLLAVLMRIVATLGQGLAQFAEIAERWLASPLLALDTAFLICLLVGILVAILVRTGLSTLAEMAPRPIAPATDDSLESAFFRADLGNQQKLAFTRLSTLLAWGGGLTLLALIGQVANFSQFGGQSRALAPAVALAGVGYLICAVLLYSRARLTFMQARWQNDGAHVDPAVVRFWSATSAALVVALVVVLLIVPRSYGMGMLDAVRNVVLIAANVFTALFTYIGLLMFGALGLLLTLPAMLMAFIALLLGAPESAPAEPLQLPPPVEAPPPVATTPNIAPGIVFWLCMGLLAGYALFTVLRRQQWALALWARLREGPLERLFAAWGALWQGTRNYAQAVSEAFTPPEAPLEADQPARNPLRRQNPTELVRRLYRALLERAAERGVGRQQAQTPYEYAQDLGEQLPDAQEDVNAITDAYVRATYAPRPTTRDEAARVRRPFARLRRRLK